MKDFLEKFIEAVEIEDASSVTLKTNFRNLEEWNSLSTLSVIALADEEYGVELNPEILRQAQTVEDLFNAIQSLK